MNPLGLETSLVKVERRSRTFDDFMQDSMKFQDQLDDAFQDGFQENTFQENGFQENGLTILPRAS
jgi:hypothetical protein